MRMLLALFVAPGLATLTASGRADEPTKSPLLAEGQLQNVRQPLTQILQLTFDGPNLKLDRQGWDAQAAKKAKPPPAINGFPFGGPVQHAFSPVEQFFQQIQSAAGAWSISRSSNGQEHEVSFQGGQLRGRLHVGGEAMRLSLEEVKPPRRSLELSAEGKIGLRCVFSEPGGDLILLQQTAQGRFTAVAVVGGKAFAGQAESFVAFFRKHRRPAQTLIVPVLDQFGILVSPDAPGVRQVVLARVLRTPQAAEAGKQFLADLSNSRFVVREQATRKLNERFELYKDLIEEKLRDKATPPEARDRLRKMVKGHTDSGRVGRLVAAFDLTRDADYLVPLLDRVKAEELTQLVRHLEAVTGQRLGSDPAAWKEWLKKRHK